MLLDSVPQLGIDPHVGALRIELLLLLVLVVDIARSDLLAAIVVQDLVRIVHKSLQEVVVVQELREVGAGVSLQIPAGVGVVGVEAFALIHAGKQLTLAVVPGRDGQEHKECLGF